MGFRWAAASVGGSNSPEKRKSGKEGATGMQIRQRLGAGELPGEGGTDVTGWSQKVFGIKTWHASLKGCVQRKPCPRVVIRVRYLLHCARGHARFGGVPDGKKPDDEGWTDFRTSRNIR